MLRALALGVQGVCGLRVPIGISEASGLGLSAFGCAEFVLGLG